MSTEMIHTRVDSDLKHDVEHIFGSVGINTSDAIRMFLAQVRLRQGIPFEIKIPNKVTRKAIEDSRLDRNMKILTDKEFHDLLYAN
jgi:DNA-damage-inducible protein J